MSITRMPLHNIAAEYPASIALFEQFDIDLCAWGDKLLGEACSALRLSADQVEEKLRALTGIGTARENTALLSLTQLIQLIVREHHRRIRQDLPALARLADRLAEKHPAQSNTYATIARLIRELHSELIAHIEKEEHIMFPVIAAMEQCGDDVCAHGGAATQSVRQPAAHMMREHAEAAHKLEKLRCLTADFTVPATACATQRALYNGLHKFEAGFGEHLHLENDVLFPRSIAAESALRERSLS